MRTIGLFEVVTPQLVGDELLDAVAMNARAEELVRSGAPFIAIDLSSLDYIYSDAINRFVQLNKILMEINGRVVIMAPHGKVVELLEKAGVTKLVKLVRSEGELLALTEAIYQMQMQNESKTLTESFEDFRNELVAGIGQLAAGADSYNQAPSVAPTPQPVAPGYMAGEPAPIQPQALTRETPVVGTYAVPSGLSEVASEDEEGFDDNEKIKKKSPLSVVVVLLVMLALGGAATMYFLFPQKPTGETTAVAQDSTARPTPQEAENVVPSVEKEKVAEKPAEVKPAVVSPKEKSETPKVVAKQEPAKPAEEKKPAIVNQLTITSVPSGAVVSVNGKKVGMTPYTFKNPPTYSDIQVMAEKSGYQSTTKRVEYMDGKSTIALTLIKEVPAKVETPAPAPKPAPTPTPVVKPAPAPAPTPKPAPAPDPTPAPAPKPAPAPAPASSAATAEIYINSLPPMADIYLNGQMVGKTNAAPIYLVPGTHTLSFVKGEKKATKQVILRTGRNSSLMIRLE